MILESLPSTIAAEEAEESPPAEQWMPQNLAHRLVSGTSTLGLAFLIERGFGFGANILAARLGGASTFGAYSLAITTANSIGTYAAGGIGATASRFSGQYPRGSRQYPALAKALLLISLISAVAAGLGLWMGAAPLAHLLHKESLTGLLSWAALSAAGVIALECFRGFLVGQHRLVALLLLSTCTGLGMISFIPLAAHFGPSAMILSQGCVAVGSVGICLLLFKPLGLGSPIKFENREPFLPVLKQVWSFGLVQLAGLVGVNAAGWWLTSLIARSDGSMVQMGFFAISHQLRNMVALLPLLLSESSYALLAGDGNENERTPDRVMAACTAVNTVAAYLLAGAITLVLPWAIPLLYGKSYLGAQGAAALALANAVIHMGNGPAGGRLSVLSLRITGFINTAWAVTVAGLATFLLFGGGALAGCAIYLGAHVFSATLVFVSLRSLRSLPPGTTLVFGLGAGSGLLLSILAVARSIVPNAAAILTIIMLIVFIGGAVTVIRIGRRHVLLPSYTSFVALGKSMIARISSLAPTAG
jgi:O-antigen/teichoic acid export membrane protein